jgi:hypothetical protein
MDNRKMKWRTLTAIFFLAVACGLVWFFGRITPGETDDIQELALRELFQKASPGFAPGQSPKWEYFAISVNQRENPSPTFLMRFRDVRPPVMACSEAWKLEPKNVLQTKGMYVTLDKVESVAWGTVQIRASVGCGWAAAIYEVVLTRSWNGWRCKSLQCTAVS